MKKKNSFRCFFMGMGSILNLMPASFQVYPSPHFKSDSDAIASDWKNIGDDIKNAIGKYQDCLEQEENTQSKK